VRTHLEVTEDVAEVDVEEVCLHGHHEVVVVAVAEAQHVARHAVRRRRYQEVVRPSLHYTQQQRSNAE
jgi:hypothetical protein